jgi:hypothetical protein
MKRSSVLAHRGLFLCESEMNSHEALKNALEDGFGIETDLRDLNGNVVISHDPPKGSSSLPTLEWLLDQIFESSSIGRIALNIKSDGLANLLEIKMQNSGVDLDRFFVFDMSIPDSLSYLKGTIPVYSRISDYEEVPAFIESAKGVWVDNFNGSFPQVERAKALIEQGCRVTVVSPELHKRDHTNLWNDILDSGLYRSSLFEICTDFPVKAANLFCEI